MLGALASWRLAHLIVHEDGPWDVVVRLRAVAGSGGLGQAMDCLYCASLWVAAPFGLLVGRSVLECLLAWLALSGAACLLERGRHHELLRREANGVAEQSSDAFHE